MRIRMCIMAGMLLLVALLLIPSVAFAQDATATRTLPTMPLDTGVQFTVQIDTDLFNGAIIETLPAECAYAGTLTVSAPCTMIAQYKPGPHQLEFVYLGALPGQCTPASFSYDLIAPLAEGTYTIAGTITDMEGSAMSNPVGGDTDIGVKEPVGPPAEDVVINEFISNPDGTDECIELYNKEATPVDLTGWSIQDGTGQPDLLDGLVIPAGGYLALQQGTDFDFQLNNTGDLIDLMKGAEFIDTIAYGNWDDGNIGDNAPVPGSGESAGRWPNGIDTDVDSDDFTIFDPAICGPTCGSVNVCTPPGAKSIRTLPGQVDPGDVFDVSVYVEGVPVGGIKENLPAGVTFVGTKPVTSIVGVAQNGQLLTLGYMLFGGPGTLTFELQAPMAAGQYTFNGIVDGTTGPPANDEVSVSILGDQILVVGTPAVVTPQVTLAANPQNVNEGNNVNIDVMLDVPCAQIVTVEVETYDQTAVAPDDYTAISELVTFNPGETDKSVFFGTQTDGLVEGDEIVGVRLVNPTNANLGVPNDIDVTIVDVPPTPKPQVRFAAGGYNVNEGDAIMVEVTLSQPGTQTITVQVQPYDKTAVNPDDYTGTTETLAFTPGDTSRTVVFGTESDGLVEGNEVFGVRLINITNAEEGTPNDIDVTIIDQPPAQVWDCPLGDMALIAPYPNNGRAMLGSAVNCDDIETDADWFIIAWLADEAGNTWQTYNTQLPLGSRGDLTQIVPGEYYYVVVSDPGTLWWD